MRAVYCEMHVPWRQAGQSLTAVMDEGTRVAGLAPLVMVERLPTLDSSGVVVQLRVTVHVPERMQDAEFPNHLASRGLIVNWWTTPFNSAVRARAAGRAASASLGPSSTARRRGLDEPSAASPGHVAPAGAL